jgi:FtsZ-binding cell division protein ZapB
VFGQKSRRILQLEQTVRDLRQELSGVQERLRTSLGHEEELRVLVSKQARELLKHEAEPVKKPRKK